jgi:hypothetical protein
MMPPQVSKGTFLTLNPALHFSVNKEGKRPRGNSQPPEMDARVPIFLSFHVKDGCYANCVIMHIPYWHLNQQKCKLYSWSHGRPTSWLLSRVHPVTQLPSCALSLLQSLGKNVRIALCHLQCLGWVCYNKSRLVLENCSRISHATTRWNVKHLAHWHPAFLAIGLNLNFALFLCHHGDSGGLPMWHYKALYQSHPTIHLMHHCIPHSLPTPNYSRHAIRTIVFGQYLHWEFHWIGTMSLTNNRIIPPDTIFLLSP